MEKYQKIKNRKNKNLQKKSENNLKKFEGWIENKIDYELYTNTTNVPNIKHEGDLAAEGTGAGETAWSADQRAGLESARTRR